jgi:hypothetical protein
LHAKLGSRDDTDGSIFEAPRGLLYRRASDAASRRGGCCVVPWTINA